MSSLRRKPTNAQSNGSPILCILSLKKDRACSESFPTPAEANLHAVETHHCCSVCKEDAIEESRDIRHAESSVVKHFVFSSYENLHQHCVRKHINFMPCPHRFKSDCQQRFGLSRQMSRHVEDTHDPSPAAQSNRTKDQRKQDRKKEWEAAKRKVKRDTPSLWKIFEVASGIKDSTKLNALVQAYIAEKKSIEEDKSESAFNTMHSNLQGVVGSLTPSSHSTRSIAVCQSAPPSDTVTTRNGNDVPGSDDIQINYSSAIPVAQFGFMPPTTERPQHFPRNFDYPITLDDSVESLLVCWIRATPEEQRATMLRHGHASFFLGLYTAIGENLPQIMAAAHTYGQRGISEYYPSQTVSEHPLASPTGYQVQHHLLYAMANTEAQHNRSFVNRAYGYQSSPTGNYNQDQPIMDRFFTVDPVDSPNRLQASQAVREGAVQLGENVLGRTQRGHAGGNHGFNNNPSR
ncbi:Protein of unknown function [Pyronema omphalodes CBS 100304]|uniref:C2H2-type domain-containing protein n=1 Tax=Pyronema omphalodes (strain CBS 100304) TaxID=1076935 RepID=U4L611_PYROM|nr:Protein of unknown function [Pyronema omphalodes CBS 100304]